MSAAKAEDTSATLLATPNNKLRYMTLPVKTYETGHRGGVSAIHLWLYTNQRIAPVVKCISILEIMPQVFSRRISGAAADTQTAPRGAVHRNWVDQVRAII